MNGSDLIKEAICDAKAVRETALLNAKVALEEAFSEKYHAMFAEKLKEDAAVGDEPVGAIGLNQPVAEEENVSDGEIDDLIKELENETGEGDHKEPDGDEFPGSPEATAGAPGAPLPPPAVPPTTGAPGEISGEPGQEVPGMGSPGAVAPGCPCPTCGVTLPAVPPTTGVPGSETPPAEPAGELPPTDGAADPAAGATNEPPPSETPPAEETDEDVDLNELLESLREEVEEENKKDDKDDKGTEKLDEDKKLASSAIGGNKAGGSANKKPSASASSSSNIESGGMKQEGMPSPDGTKVGPEDATKAKRPNEAKNATSTNLTTPSMGGKSGPALQAKRPNEADHATSTDLSTPGGMLQENKDLKEALTYVKGQLNEVNLLNAKLLYTNKLFKEYNMDNSQKMRIVEMFDLSKNVREVKLTYANIAESLNFSNNDIKKKIIKGSSNIQSITEGLASQAIGSTKPTKEIITEGKFASRMKELAGIKSEKKK